MTMKVSILKSTFVGLLPAIGLLSTSSAQATSFDFQKLFLTPGAYLDGFGRAIEIHGDRMVVTANAADAMGAAYAYRRIAGVWTQEQKFRGADTAQGDFFGFDAALDGPNNRLVVGAYQADPGETNSGAAYVFEYSGGSWVETQKLTALDGAAFDRFGRDPHLHGDLLVVGATGDDDGGLESGSAYVFRRTGGTFIFEQKLTASTADPADEFGWSTAIDGTTILVCAISDESGPNETGAVFAFEHDGSSWQEVQRIVPTDAANDDRFGWQMDAEDGVLVIGATNHDMPFNNGGAVYVFEKNGGSWVQTQKIIGDGVTSSDSFGWSVGLSGSRLLVGASGSEGIPSSPPGFDGALYRFYDDGSRWVQVTRYMSGEPSTVPIFLPQLGMACAIDGTTVAGGAPFQNGPTVNTTGVAYVFSEDVVYCIPKTNSLDCAPSVSISGTPSVTDPNPFLVSASMLLNNRNGLLFYGYLGGPTSASFFGGTLCVQPPLRRTPIQSAGGSPPPANDCSGQLMFDFNALVQSGSDPLLVSGAQINAQYWARDPQHPDGTGTSLSDAAEFVIGN